MNATSLFAALVCAALCGGTLVFTTPPAPAPLAGPEPAVTRVLMPATATSPDLEILRDGRGRTIAVRNKAALPPQASFYASLARAAAEPFNFPGTYTDEQARPPRYMTRNAYNRELVSGIGTLAATVFLALAVLAQLTTRPGSRPHLLWPVTATFLLAGIVTARARTPAPDVVIVEADQVFKPGTNDSDSKEALFRKWLESVAKVN